ncbi:MAG: Fic family protein [Selenomonadaceae bacterium]|nr:Fic family protein [Selenomonadaceae bacterium]
MDVAAWIHAEFVRIHPFADGNGRTARMIMNYELMRGEFLPIVIKTKNREKYYAALDLYAASGDINEFTEFVYAEEKTALQWFWDFYGEK